MQPGMSISEAAEVCATVVGVGYAPEAAMEYGEPVVPDPVMVTPEPPTTVPAMFVATPAAKPESTMS